VLGAVVFATFVFEGQARYHLPIVPLIIVSTALRLSRAPADPVRLEA
jgi:hypothetical protein